MKKDQDYLIRFFRYLKPYRAHVIAGLVSIPLIAAVHLVQPLLMKRGIDNHILKGDWPGLFWVAGIYGVCVLLEFVLRSFQGFIFQYVGQYTIADIRKDLFSHILGLSMGYFDKTPQGVISSRLTSDMESLNDSFTSGVVTIIADVLTIFGILVAMFFLSPKLTLLVILTVPPIALLVYICQQRLRQFFVTIRTTMGALNAMLQEQIEGLMIIQLFQRQKKNLIAFMGLNKQYRQATLSAVYYDAFLFSFMESMSSILIAGVIWYGWGQHLGGALSLGLLVAFVEYIQKFFQPLKELSNKFAVLQQALAALEKIFGTFDINETVSRGNQALETEALDIVFEDVSFAYKGYEDKKILDRISFSIKPGEVVALVGPTGSGKTTIGKLIYRLYEGYTGSIRLGGVELREISLESLRGKIATVSQETQLFSDTLGFNISLGNPNITKEKMQQTAEFIGADSFVRTFKDGFDTPVENRGGALSTGQGQLVSLIRALSVDAPLILLDEATASIDSLSESLIQSALAKIFKQKTVLVIAHRLSTIQHADKILALKKGRIVEAGTHQDLLRKDGFYARLHHMGTVGK